MVSVEKLGNMIFWEKIKFDPNFFPIWQKKKKSQAKQQL